MDDSIKDEIARIVYWKQVAAAHDKDKALPWHLPNLAARTEEIELAERKLGPLPAEFRALLSIANGWKGFLLLTDLFGTEAIQRFDASPVRDRPEIESYLTENDWPADEVIVIGASAFDLDVFLLIPESAAELAGGIVWFAQEEVDRFESVTAFLSAMVNYNARTAEKMKARALGG